MQTIPMLAMAIFLAYNHGKLNSGDPSELSVREQIVGSWQSENLGLDFPMWFVNTYHADGKVTCDLYVKPKDEVIHHESSTRIENWRVVEDTLEIGKILPDGAFEKSGGAYQIHVSTNGKILGIEGWTRVTWETQ